MEDVILSLKQIEDIFQSLTVRLTGLDPNKGVRIAWPSDGAPGWGIDQNVVFLRIAPISDPYIQQRETMYQQQEGDGGITTTVVASYTRVHLVHWIVYGPNSYEYAETIRNGIYLQDVKSTLAANNLYLILDVPPVNRVPELFNGQWWQRCDLLAKFNEHVTRYSTVPNLAGISISLKADDGQTRNIN